MQMVRWVISDEVERADDVTEYDRHFPFQIRTRSIEALPRERWVDVKTLLEELEVTRGKKNWGWMFRQSIRELKPADGRRVVAEIRRAAEAKQ